MDGLAPRARACSDAKVKWMHDEVCVGCLMLIAHPPQPAATEPPVSAEAGEKAEAAWGGRGGEAWGGGRGGEAGEEAEAGEEPEAAWAARTLRRTRAYAERAFRLQWRGSWKVGGDRWAKPDPDQSGVSGYNMGCASLPNRVEHCARPPPLAQPLLPPPPPPPAL
jgi:hypothetical protein